MLRCTTADGASAESRTSTLSTCCCARHMVILVSRITSKHSAEPLPQHGSGRHCTPAPLAKALSKATSTPAQLSWQGQPWGLSCQQLVSSPMCPHSGSTDSNANNVMMAQTCCATAVLLQQQATASESPDTVAETQRGPSPAAVAGPTIRSVYPQPLTPAIKVILNKQCTAAWWEWQSPLGREPSICPVHDRLACSEESMVCHT